MASATVNIQQTEPVINRWLVDFYLFLAIDLFEKKQYNEFCAIRDLFDRVLSRPLESSETTPAKLRVLQFLSWIKDGESFDFASDEDPALSPLESALHLLQTMREDCPLQSDYVKLSSSLKEMIVRIFIMKGEFGRAKKALRHFPKSMVDKKAIFMSLINQRVQTTIDPMELIKFREEMLGFCQKLCQFTTPFLLKAAVRLIGSRRTEPDNIDEEEPGQHSCKPCNRMFIAKSRLEAGFKVLADEASFVRLEKDLEEEESQAQGSEEIKDQLYLTNSGSPLEASPAEEPAQISDVPQAQTGSLSKSPTNNRSYTVARLVMEPDTPIGSPDLDTELTPKETLEISENMDITQCPLIEGEISRPLRKLKSCNRAKATSAEEEEEEEEEELSDAYKTNASRESENENVMVADGLDGSPIPVLKDDRQTSSTPHKIKSSPPTKWKQAFNSAKESKEEWSDEEVLFDEGSPNESLTSNASQRKRKWTDAESQRLKEGVEKYGEGHWSKIKAYCKFKDRSNVNLKDRWRTMKKLKLV
ncbi:telomeric repeat binding factor a [Eucyclogobius newberryi]|uniref:telomeric repeat binding factor a n=1 Tax=Eucyclogobius newberryi TaxID=166745 RepID=UPI003B5CA81A